MKKPTCLLLTMLAAMLLLFSGLASADEIISLNQANTYETAADLCFMGDTLYILGNRGIYTYDGNELTTCVDLSDAYPYRYSPKRPEDEGPAAAWDRIISHLFTDGEKLYGLHPYTGQIFEITSGELKAHAQLTQDLLYVSDEDFYREIMAVVYAGDNLVLLLGTDSYEAYDKTEIVLADLKAQTYRVSTVQNAKSMAAGEDGKLLVYIEDERGAAIWTYDTQSDALESEVIALEAGVSPGGLQGFGPNAVFLEDSRVKVADVQGSTMVKAYLPIRYANLSAPAACSKQGIYAYGYANYVFLRDVSGEGEAQQTVLTVMGHVDGQTLIDFSVQNPDIAVVTREEIEDSALLMAAVSKDESTDLFILPVPGSYSSMLRKGYLAPMDSSALMQEAKKLYPAIQEVVFSGEQLYGYPTYFQPYCWMVNETKWNAFGLGAYPTTYAELLQTIDLWMQNKAEDYPDYTVSELHQAGLTAFILSMVEAYILEYEGAEDPFTFDTPSFREALQTVAEYAYLFDSEHEQGGMALLNSNYLGFGYAYTDSDLNRMVYRPTLSTESPQTMYAQAKIMAVSAASQQKEAAMRFVEFCMENLPIQTKYEMIPSLNTPVENPDYAARTAEVNAELQQWEQQYAQAATTEEQDTLSGLIAGAQNLLHSLENNRFILSAESIAVYRGMGEQMKIPYDSGYLGSSDGFESLSDVVWKFAGDGFEVSEIDAMIRELDRVAYMVHAENP